MPQMTADQLQQFLVDGFPDPAPGVHLRLSVTAGSDDMVAKAQVTYSIPPGSPVAAPPTDEALDAIERRVFFDQLSTRYSELREDTDGWTALEAERNAEDAALRDRSG